MSEFIWDKFNERTYEEFRKMAREMTGKHRKAEKNEVFDDLYIGSVHIGEICVDLKLVYVDDYVNDQKVKPGIDYDIYVANVNTGYGYKITSGGTREIPYDWVGGGSVDDFLYLETESYKDFQKILSEVLADEISKHNKEYSSADLLASAAKDYLDF